MSPRRRLSPFEQIPAIGDGGLVLSKSDLVRRRARLVARRRRRAELDTAAQYRSGAAQARNDFPHGHSGGEAAGGVWDLERVDGQKKNRSFS
jgi:hypothetical protein